MTAIANFIVAWLFNNNQTYNKIGLIKKVRTNFGLNLREAKTEVERWESTQPFIPIIKNLWERIRSLEDDLRLEKEHGAKWERIRRLENEYKHQVINQEIEIIELRRLLSDLKTTLIAVLGHLDDRMSDVDKQGKVTISIREDSNNLMIEHIASILDKV